MEKDVNRLRLAKEALESGSYDRETIEYIFPKLKEPEDERIRKDIITYLSTAEDKELIPYESWIAWLEKQGEQKDFYTKQQLRDMGFAFSSNGDIVPLDTINEAIKEYLANEKKKWENDQKPVEWSEEDEQFLLVCENALAKYQVSDKWDAGIISRWLENRLKPLRPQSPTKTN